MAAFEKLFDDVDQNDGNLTINKRFASKYQKFKECQELDRLKQKYGDAPKDDSESESEDDDAEALTPRIEKDFLKTLSMIKCKDPNIYKKETVFFDHSDDSDSKLVGREEKKQPIYLKDYERERLLAKGSKAYLSDSEDEDTTHFLEKNSEDLTYNEEQEHLKKSFKVAIESESDGDQEDLLTVRKKTSDEIRKEDQEYKSWLTTEGKKLGALDRYWNNDELDEGEKFLRDYILKKQYIDYEEKIPTYNEVVGGSDKEEEEDDDEVDREEEFERKFNFRFQEPDQEFIKRYPRTVAESVRRKDDKRKEHRKDREERKKKEKEQKKEELKRLKKLKRKEIMEKIEKLKEITGNNKVGFLEDDMDGDFDASKYDQLMTQVFDDGYYDEEDVEKPTFSDEEDYFEENWDEWTGEQHSSEADIIEEDHSPHCEDQDFNMDADYVPENNKRVPGKQKKLSKFAQAVQRRKPIFNPDEKSFQEYFDEYYKLDFEDIIDDMPVRFKYRSCMPNNFGLSTDEILKADDKELNEWCSLKKTMRYNNEEEEKKERQRYKKKSRNQKKKLQVFQSLYNEEQDENANETKIRKPRSLKSLQKKKEKTRNLHNSSKTQFKRRSLSSKFSAHKFSQGTVRNSKLKKLEKQFKGSNTEHMKKLSLERLAAYGLDKRKKK